MTASIPHIVANPTAAGKPAIWPSPSRAWWAVFVFFLCAVLAYTDRQILSLLVDPIRADLKIDDTQVSLLQGLAFALIYSVAGLPVGRLADTRPRQVVMLTGVVIWTAATVACGLAHGFNALFAARLLVGAGEAVLAPAAVSMIADLFPPHRRGTPISILFLGMRIGSGAALGFGGGLLQLAQAHAFAGIPVIAAVAPWRAVLLLLAAPGAVVAVFLVTVREPLRHSLSTGPAVSLREAAKIIMTRWRSLVPLWGALALLPAGDSAFYAWAPTLLHRAYHLPPAIAGADTGVAAIMAGILGTLCGGLLGDRFAARGGLKGRLVGAAFLASLGLLACLIGVRSQPAMAVACFASWLFLSSAGQVVGIAGLQDVAPNEVRGLNIALTSFCVTIFGLGLGTTITAVLSEHVFHGDFSIGPSLAVVATGASLSATLLFRLAAGASAQTSGLAHDAAAHRP